MRALRIAMIGQKGIPARYGGIETHVEQIATRLAAKGHDVSVYCRDRFKPGTTDFDGRNGFEETAAGVRYNGVRLLFRPSINTKHFDAASHTLLCAFETSVRQSFDIVHFHGIGPAAFVPVVKSTRQTVISTIHALDWRQVKWGDWAKRRLKQGEATAVNKSDGVIAVSNILVKYIQERYGVDARYIPNGASVSKRLVPKRIKQYGLHGDDYILTVGRVIPDRGLHYLIDAFKGVTSAVKLVIVGSELPRTSYSDKLEAMADDRVVFTGDLYGRALDELYSNCRFYVLASEVEGLPISVCEAMGFGKAVLLSDIPENGEVGGDTAEYFKVGDTSDLQAQLNRMLEPAYDLEARGQAGRRRIGEHYNWDRLADEVEAYYYEVIDRT